MPATCRTWFLSWRANPSAFLASYRPQPTQIRYCALQKCGEPREGPGEQILITLRGHGRCCCSKSMPRSLAQASLADPAMHVWPATLVLPPAVAASSLPLAALPPLTFYFSALKKYSAVSVVLDLHTCAQASRCGRRKCMRSCSSPATSTSFSHSSHCARAKPTSRAPDWPPTPVLSRPRLSRPLSRSGPPCLCTAHTCPARHAAQLQHGNEDHLHHHHACHHLARAAGLSRAQPRARRGGGLIPPAWHRYMRKHRVVSQTYSKEEETFKVVYLLVPTFLLALLVNHEFSVIEARNAARRRRTQRRGWLPERATRPGRTVRPGVVDVVHLSGGGCHPATAGAALCSARPPRRSPRVAAPSPGSRGR